MKLKYIFDGFFAKFVPALLFSFLLASTSVDAQTENIELRSLDNSGQKISAGVQLLNISKFNFDVLFQKISESKLFSVTKEFNDEKLLGYLSFKSPGYASIQDLQTLLMSAGIEKIKYSGELMNVSELQAKYKPLNKIEVRQRPNR